MSAPAVIPHWVVRSIEVPMVLAMRGNESDSPVPQTFLNSPAVLCLISHHVLSSGPWSSGDLSGNSDLCKGFDEERELSWRGMAGLSCERRSLAIDNHPVLGSFSSLVLLCPDGACSTGKKVASGSASSLSSTPSASRFQRKVLRIPPRESAPYHSFRLYQQVVGCWDLSGRSFDWASVLSIHRISSKASRTSALGRQALGRGGDLGTWGWIFLDRSSVNIATRTHIGTLFKGLLSDKTRKIIRLSHGRREDGAVICVEMIWNDMVLSQCGGAIFALTDNLERQMRCVNYYDLLKDGVEAVQNLDWEEVLRSVVYYRNDLEDSDAAIQALYNIFLECSREWVAQRSKIVREVSSKHSNPRRQSDYCLKALREITDEASRESARRSESPGSVIVQRQVSDHLRELNHSGQLVSCMVRSTSGKDLYKLWGLEEWGQNWMKSLPEKPLEEVSEDLPVIEASREGQGIFDYARILPLYIPAILVAYGAALSTSQIKSVVCGKISPPLVDERTPVTGDDQPSPEDEVVKRQRLKEFIDQLKDREKRALQMFLGGIPKETIADSLKVSLRTVENDIRRIEDIAFRVAAFVFVLVAAWLLSGNLTNPPS
jgi:hypothetical protein